jgi:hypothetical protein
MTSIVKCLQDILGYLVFSHNKTLETIVTYFLQSIPQKKLFYQHDGEKLAKKIVLTSMIVFKKDSNDKSENIIGG